MVASRRMLMLLAALLCPALGQAQESRRVAGIDTEHIFGFTEGSDIGKKGEKEIESSLTGRFGKPRRRVDGRHRRDGADDADTTGAAGGAQGGVRRYSADPGSILRRGSGRHRPRCRRWRGCCR